MKTADEFVTYCNDNNTGQGFSKSQMAKHFALVEGQLQTDEYGRVAFIGLRNFSGLTKHDNNFAFLITNKRIIMAQKKVIGAEVKSVSLDNINDVTMNLKLAFGIIEFDSIKEKFNVAVNKQQAQAVHDLIHDSLSSKITEPEKPDPMTQLVALKQLLDMQAITQEEFDSKKAQLLNLI